MHDPAVTNLGILARTTHDKAAGLPAVYAERLIRLSTRYEQAQREMEQWKPYPLANVIPSTAPIVRRIDWTSKVLTVAAAIVFVALIVW